MSNREIDEGEVQNNGDMEIQNQAGEPEIPTPVMANPTGVGVFFGMLTLIGTRIGGGIVGIPYASQQIGFITSLGIQIVYSGVAVFSSFLLLKVREITGESSLSNIGYFGYGRISIFFINALTALTQLGFPIIFFIVFGDVAGGLIEKVNSSGISFWSSRWFTHTILAAAIFYLVLKKEIHQLKYAGFGLILLIGIFIILFFIHYLTSNPHPSPQADLIETKLGIKFLSLLPTLATSYAIHPSFFTAFLSLKYKTTKNGTKTSMISIGILFTFYTISPLISYGLYGANIKSNMLKNVVEDTGVLPVILGFIYMMIAVIHIPIIFFIGKEAVLIFFDEATRRSYSKAREDDQAPAKSNIESEAPAQLSNQEHEDEKDEQNDQPEDEHSKIIGRDQINNNERSPTDKVNEADLKPRQTFNPISAEANSLQYMVEHSASKRPDPKEYLHMKQIYYYSLTIAGFIVVVILSIVVGDVSVFFGVIGSTVAGFMVLLGPGSFYIITVHKKKVKFDSGMSIFFYAAAWIISFFGALGMIGLNIGVIIQSIK